MINYHIKEVLAEVNQTQPKEGDSTQLINDYERYKIRQEVSNSLLKEGWIPEAVTLFETTKVLGDTD